MVHAAADVAAALDEAVVEAAEVERQHQLRVHLATLVPCWPVTAAGARRLARESASDASQEMALALRFLALKTHQILQRRTVVG
jgi:phage-related tail fiber protein